MEDSIILAELAETIVSDLSDGRSYGRSRKQIIREESETHGVSFEALESLVSQKIGKNRSKRNRRQ